MLMIVLDATIVNVALPSIRDRPALQPAGLAWVVNAYLIAFGGLLLLAGGSATSSADAGVFLAAWRSSPRHPRPAGFSVNQEMLVGADGSCRARGAR